MPFIEDDVVQYFEKEIKESAQENIKQLTDKIEHTKQTQLKEIEDQIRETVDKNVEIELNELNVEFSANTNRIKANSHQEVIKKKHELLDSILLDVREKCVDFVKSPIYKTTMKHLVKKVNDDFCGEKFTFRIKKGDTVLKNIITENFTKKPIIEESDSITIGGFVGVCFEKGILTDQTIDNKLEKATVKLYETSNLAVK